MRVVRPHGQVVPIRRAAQRVVVRRALRRRAADGERQRHVHIRHLDSGQRGAHGVRAAAAFGDRRRTHRNVHAQAAQVHAAHDGRLADGQAGGRDSAARRRARDRHCVVRGVAVVGRGEGQGGGAAFRALRDLDALGSGDHVGSSAEAQVHRHRPGGRAVQRRGHRHRLRPERLADPVRAHGERHRPRRLVVLDREPERTGHEAGVPRFRIGLARCAVTLHHQGLVAFAGGVVHHPQERRLVLPVVLRVQLDPVRERHVRGRPRSAPRRQPQPAACVGALRRLGPDRQPHLDRPHVLAKRFRAPARQGRHHPHRFGYGDGRPSHFIPGKRGIEDNGVVGRIVVRGRRDGQHGGAARLARFDGDALRAGDPVVRSRRRAGQRQRQQQLAGRLAVQRRRRRHRSGPRRLGDGVRVHRQGHRSRLVVDNRQCRRLPLELRGHRRHARIPAAAVPFDHERLLAFRQAVVNDPEQPHTARAPAVARLELPIGGQERHILAVRLARSRQAQATASVLPGIRRVFEGQRGAYPARVLAHRQWIQRPEVHHQRAPRGCQHRLRAQRVASRVPRPPRHVRVRRVGQRHRGAAAQGAGQRQHHLRGCLGLGGRHLHRRDRHGDRRAAVGDRQREIPGGGRRRRPHRLAQGQRHPAADIVRRNNFRRHRVGLRRR